MKKAQYSSLGAVMLLSAAVSAVTTLAVLVVHTLCTHSDGKWQTFCILPDSTETS